MMTAYLSPVCVCVCVCVHACACACNYTQMDIGTHTQSLRRIHALIISILIIDYLKPEASSNTHLSLSSDLSLLAIIAIIDCLKPESELRPQGPSVILHPEEADTHVEGLSVRMGGWGLGVRVSGLGVDLALGGCGHAREKQATKWPALSRSCRHLRCAAEQQ